MDTPPLANFLGFLGLGSYIITLLPTIIKTLFPQIKKNRILKILLKYRRQIGVTTFFFSLSHGFLMVSKRDLDFLDLTTYGVYIQGIVTLIVFTLLAITSNNWSIKKLRQNWKKLHSLTYLAMFLLTWHVWDKMFNHWTFLTPVGLLGLMGITTLFMLRKQIEHQ
jgi:methionine sulfoxide reductase heme-binding subunit